MSMAVIGVGVTAAGVGASMYSANKAAKGSGQSMPSSSYQLKDAKMYTKAQQKLDKSQAELALKMYPQFAAAQLEAERAAREQSIKQALEYYPQFAGAERGATAAQRTQDIKDFTANSAGWASQLDAISPAYARLGEESATGGADTPLLQYLNAQAFAAGPSPLRSTLEWEAMYDLSLGGSLSAQEERGAYQAARGAWSDRGLVNSNPAVAAEVLNRDYLARQRQDQRRQFAGNVQQMGFAEDNSNRQFGINVQAQNEAARGNWRNFLINAGQAEVNPIIGASMTRTNVNPYGVFGAASGVPSPYGVSSVFATAPQIAQGVQAVQPLYNTAFSAAESRANASANAWGAIGGGLTSVGGSMYGAGM